MIFKKQNDEKALTFLKAAVYCNRKEKISKFVIIILSVIVCLLGIFNKTYKFLEMLDEILFPNSTSTGSLWVVVISGTVMILNAFLAIRARRFSIEGTNIMEKYDNYVYGIPENTFIMRPLSPIIIENYARKVKDKKGKLNNFYFKTIEQSEKKNAVYENQFKLFKDQYKLMLFVKGFFQTVWILFFVGVIAISVNFDDTFVSTLANILIPSLSIILLIVNSWHLMNEGSRYLQNCINTLERAKKENEDGALNSRLFLRSVQDAVFKFRGVEFLVPNFLKRRFEKLEEKNNAHFSSSTVLQNLGIKDKEPSKEAALKVEKDKSEQKPKVAATEVKAKEEAKPKVEAVEKEEAKPKSEPKVEVKSAAKVKNAAKEPKKQKQPKKVVEKQPKPVAKKKETPKPTKK